MTEPRTFEEFWPYYVSQHRDPRCRRLHVVGTATGLAFAAASPLVPPLLLAAPIVGYGCSWVGHFLYEKNRPASWHSAKHFAWSFRADLRMLHYTLVGRMDGEVARTGAPG